MTGVTALPHAAVPLIKLQTATVPTSFGNMAIINMDISFSVVAKQQPTISTSSSSWPPSTVGSAELTPSSSSSSATSSYSTRLKWFYSSSSSSSSSSGPSLVAAVAAPAQLLALTGVPEEPAPAPRALPPPLPAHRGLENTRFVERLCALHPPLTALVLVLKQLLHERGLNDPYKGGLGACKEISNDASLHRACCVLFACFLPSIDRQRL